MTLSSIIETILFAHGEPMSIAALADITSREQSEVTAALEELEHNLAPRGICMLRKEHEVELGTNPANAAFIDEMVKQEFSQELSRSSMETLAIICYKGPLTRVQIDYIRGVNSSFILRMLLMRGLIERIDNPKDSRSYLYRPTFDFLKHFGITNMEELPRFEEFQAEILVAVGNAEQQIAKSR